MGECVSMTNAAEHKLVHAHVREVETPSLMRSVDADIVAQQITGLLGAGAGLGGADLLSSPRPPKRGRACVRAHLATLTGGASDKTKGVGR